ncbi:MAG: M20 metallopeptidase family protein [Bacteroidota bacterium]
MEKIKNLIKEKARVYHSETIAIRRHIHSNPELSAREYETATFVEQQLDKIGIKHKRMAKTGVIGFIEGAEKGPALALRADMDALPINEENTHNYVSKNEGVMHACGHDAHTAILLGTARILYELREHLGGNIVLVFQPSEENLPGGAKMLLEEGLFNKYPVQKIFGLHVDPEIESGKIGMRGGQYMASTDEIYLTVKGKGGHGATPDKNVDTVLMGAQILTNLQQIVSRNAPPEIPTVLSFGRFIADGRTNIIPDEVKMDGTLRTFDETWRENAHQRITEVAQNTAMAAGGSCDVVIDRGYPYLVNDEKLTARCFDDASEFLGLEKVLKLNLRMTAEDFAYYSQQVPACFYRLGIRNEEKGIISNLHTSTFNIDERSLETGIGIMSYLAFRNLSSSPEAQDE